MEEKEESINNELFKKYLLILIIKAQVTHAKNYVRQKVKK